MGRPKIYKTAKSLEKAVNKYFSSISRTVTAQEKYETGEKDSDGHKIYAFRDILNDSGEPIRYTEYVVPPTIGDLAEFLSIHRATWDNYCDGEKYPEFIDTTTRARGRIRAYNERELLTRTNVKGVIFNLQNNFGMTEKVETVITGKTAESETLSVTEKMELIKKMLKEGAADDEGGG